MNRKTLVNGKILSNHRETREISGNHSKAIELNISEELKTVISYSVFLVLKSMKLKKE
jgi:hypothetical protein